MTVPSTPTLAPAAKVPPLQAAVPWSTVLPIAALLAYADGFWMTSLHGAVGDISRTQEPFISYWRTSTLMLPMFVLAVLGALALALRRFGSELRSWRAVAATALLIAAAATLAAVSLSAVSGAYDLYLQSGHLHMMQSMQHDCSTSCLSRQEWATIGAHGRAIAYTGAALLLTNIALVGWAVGLRGGQLRVCRADLHAGRRAVAAVDPGDRAKDLRWLIITALLAAAAIHAAVVPEHVNEWPLAGMFFIVLAVAEVAVADRLSKPRTRAGLIAAALFSAGPLLVWVVSRTAGLPFGPDPGTAEAVGLADVVASALELGTLVAALALLRSSGQQVRPADAGRHRAQAHRQALAVVAIIALGALGLAGAESDWLDGADASTSVEMVHDSH